MKYRLTAPAGKLKGVVKLPTSKSISNRLLIMRALSRGRVNILNLSESEDTMVMEKAFIQADHHIKAGHAGTAMRFLTAYLSVAEGDWTLSGSERMHNRPIGALVDALRLIGADIRYIEKEGFPPLAIRGKKLEGGLLHIDGSISSQYISALLMIAPVLPLGLQLVIENSLVSSSYVRLTLDLMQRLGVLSDWKGNLITIARQDYQSGDITVEPDWSAASYWYELLALTDDAELLLADLRPGSRQGDAAIEAYFDSLGVKTGYTSKGALLKRICSSTHFIELDFTDTPDMVQTFAVLCCLLDVSFRFTGTQSLRIKETDRVAALSRELEKFGAILEYDGKGTLSWKGPLPGHPKGGLEIDTYEDHRMALSFTPACMKTGDIIIREPAVVAKSYPGFWQELRALGFGITELP